MNLLRNLSIYFLLAYINVAYSNENIYGQTQGFANGAGYIETIRIPSPPYDVSQNTPEIDDAHWITSQEGLYYINATADNTSDLTNGCYESITERDLIVLVKPDFISASANE